MLNFKENYSYSTDGININRVAAGSTDDTPEPFRSAVLKSKIAEVVVDKSTKAKGAAPKNKGAR